MKFHDDISARLFLLEIGESFDDSITKEFTPTEEMMELFLKGRSLLVNKLLDFRKSQLMTGEWRKDRWKFLKGIRRFHSSTAGKRFHRQLGNFLATNSARDGFLSNGLLSADESLLSPNTGNLLKAISSARTHAYIETEYYHTLDEQVDYLLFLDEFMKVTLELEEKIYNNIPLDRDDTEAILNILGEYNIKYELKNNNPDLDIDALYESCYKEDNDYPLTEVYLELLGKSVLTL